MNIGDVVTLKSGGPKMTVVSKTSLSDVPNMNCSWFEGPMLYTGSFPQEALRLTEKPKKSSGDGGEEEPYLAACKP